MADTKPQCTAKAKSTKKRCRRTPVPGATVCRFHGGSAPQVRAAGARRILEALVAPALIELRRLIEDPAVLDTVKIRAVDSILDRSGYKAPTKLEGAITLEMVEQEIAKLEAEEIE